MSAKSKQQSCDFRDVVKDFIYKDTRGLSAKTSTSKEVKTHAYKHRDSPRPMLLSKSMDGTYIIGIDGKLKVPMDLHGSLRVLKQLKEAPLYFSEASEQPKSSYEAKHTSHPASSETPWLSCDGREFARRSLDSRENSKSSAAIKLTELPRLSLDSRESYLRSSNLEWKLNSMMKDLERTKTNRRVLMTSNLHQELGSSKHHSSVILKLMGLEALPSLDPAAEEPITKRGNGLRGNNASPKPLRAIRDRKDDPRSHSSKSCLKDSVRPKVKDCDSVVRLDYGSRSVTQAAHWRQRDSDHIPRNATLGYQEAHMKKETELVYSEIEKRLKELEFPQSNKDLRALKQIFDAMHAKGLLETKKGDDHKYKISVQKNYSSHIPIGDYQNVRTQNVQRASARGSSSPRVFDSPIVIMRPAKLAKSSAPSVIPLESLSGFQKVRTGGPVDRKKGSTNRKMIKDESPKASYKKSSNHQSLSKDKEFHSRTKENGLQETRLHVMHGFSRFQHSLRENSRSSVRTSSSVSPRLQQRKSEAEKKSSPPIPPNVNKPQRQSPNRQPPELVSPRGKLRSKPSHALQSNDRLNEKASDKRNSVHSEDEISQWSDSNISSESQADAEATSVDQIMTTNSAVFQQGFMLPPRRCANYAVLALDQKKPSIILNEDMLLKEIANVAAEQPTPVSFLDASFYQEDLLPSPMKRIPNEIKDEKICTSVDCQTKKGLPDAPPPKMISEINYKKLENIENLVQQLKKLTSTNDEPATIDHAASLCNTKNMDHQYVSEILLVSDILVKDLRCGLMCSMPIQLHPSGHPINPDLFFVLEQTKSAWFSKPEPVHENILWPKPDPEKLHRKLIFDVVNEILIHKMELLIPNSRCNLLLEARKLSCQHLLKELCSEVDQLQAERLKASSFDDGNLISCKNLLCQSEGWTDFGSELPGLVSEIERLIFKGLVDEVLTGEAAFHLQKKPSRRRKQLSDKCGN